MKSLDSRSRAGRCWCLAWPLVVVGLLIAGCNQNPFLNAQQTSNWGQTSQQSYLAQLQDLQRRAFQLDANNRDLHGDVARSQQQVQLLQDEVALLRKQLADTAGQLRDVQLAKQRAEKRVEAIEASTRHRGGASISANNSLRSPLSVAEIPGVEVRQEGDVIRFELSADRLFHQGTSQLLPTANLLLDQVAQTITREYPKQLVGLEGHTDSTPAGATGNHQLSSSQAVAVFEALTRRNRIPSGQLFTVGYGANHPRASNATPADRSKNRRVEVVIYPETVDGN